MIYFAFAVPGFEDYVKIFILKEILGLKYVLNENFQFGKSDSGLAVPHLLMLSDTAKTRTLAKNLTSS